MIWIGASWELVTVNISSRDVAAGSAGAGEVITAGVRHGAAALRELLGVEAYGALRSTLDANGIPYHRDRLV